jgi:hypothetical protein
MHQIRKPLAGELLSIVPQHDVPSAGLDPWHKLLDDLCRITRQDQAGQDLRSHVRERGIYVLWRHT